MACLAAAIGGALRHPADQNPVREEGGRGVVFWFFSTPPMVAGGNLYRRKCKTAALLIALERGKKWHYLAAHRKTTRTNAHQKVAAGEEGSAVLNPSFTADIRNKSLAS